MAKIPAVLIFGAPGSGKGTVGAKLAATTSLKHISTGDIFRGIAPSNPASSSLLTPARACSFRTKPLSKFSAASSKASSIRTR